MGKPGHRSARGTGEIYEQPKSRVQVVKLTPFAYFKLRSRAAAMGLTYSEYVERLIRDDGGDHGQEAEDS